jgi:hypothetical protein
VVSRRRRLWTAKMNWRFDEVNVCCLVMRNNGLSKLIEEQSVKDVVKRTVSSAEVCCD